MNQTETSHDPTLRLPKAPPCFAWLVVLNGPRRGRLLRLKAEGVTLGRSDENDIVLEDETISRFHARILAEPDGEGRCFVVQDLASANGTYVNGRRVSRHPLRDEDRLKLGQTVFAFKEL